MTSCVKNEKDNDVINDIKNESNNIKNVDTDKVQLWYYTYTQDSFYYDSFYIESISKIVDSAKKFCEKNNIDLEIWYIFIHYVSLFHK